MRAAIASCWVACIATPSLVNRKNAKTPTMSAAAIAIGQNTDATGANSIAIGGNATDANSADATGASSIAIGDNSLADAATKEGLDVINLNDQIP